MIFCSRFLVGFFASLIVVCGVYSAEAQQVPRSFTVQGVLTDDASKPIADGIYTITVRLYAQAIGGMPIHAEEFLVPVKDGLFNLAIGERVAIPASVKFDRQYFVGISYNGGVEALRLPLTSVPYSLMAETVSDGAITTAKIADGSITSEKLSPALITSLKGGDKTLANTFGAPNFVGGGDLNAASALNVNNYNAILGGRGNTVNAQYATIGGGFTNKVFAANGTVAGGNTNTVSATYGFIGSGQLNNVTGAHGAIAGGFTNKVQAGWGAIAGGSTNTVNGGNGFIGGGASNSITGVYGTISGGFDNTASGTHTAVGGGHSNQISGNYGIIAGGYSNQVSGNYGVIAGGNDNLVSGMYGGVLGGYSNLAAGQYGTVLGGWDNSAAGNYSVVLGGSGLTFTADAANSIGYLKYTASRSMSISTPNVAVFGNTDLWLASNDGTTRALKLFSNNLDAAGAYPSTIAKNVALKAPDALAADYTLVLPSSAGTSGQVLATNGSGTLSWVTAASPGLSHFTESVSTVAPNGSVPVVQLSASNAALNVDVALTPKGTGALTAQVADNTSTGGNKRGDNSVDWQMVRSDAAMVASGFRSFIGSGEDNTAAVGYSVVAGGIGNTAGEVGAVVSGGTFNIASQTVSTVSGGTGNSAIAEYSAVGGGVDNIASGSGSTVGGGLQNYASGFASVVSGGNTNQSHGSASVVVGGELNTVGPTASWTTILGGSQLTMTGSSSIGYLAQPQSGGTVRMEVAATNTAVFGNVDLWLASNDNTPRSLRFYEQYQYNSYSPFPNTANYVGFKAPNNIASDVTWTLPDADGSNGQVLFTNGNGVLSWTTPTASGSAGGDLSGSYPNPSIAAGAVTDAKVASGISGSKISGDITGYAANVTGTVALANGGTGATTASSARTNLGLGGLAVLSAVGTTEITDANVTMAKLAQAGATSGQVIKWNGSAWAPAADDAGSSLTNFTESVTTAAPNATVPAVQLLATNTEANVDVALTPKGTGALGAQVADNTTSGGNKRGENSVDWQMVRSDAAMVASGIKSVIGGGEDNIASADYSATLSGYTNTANEIGAVVSGGTINTAHGLVSTVGGGTSNSAMADYSTVSGGMENTANQSSATVSGGQGNTASGASSVVGGGYGNYSQGAASVIVGGDHNTIEPTATWTTILGGSQLTMTGSSSIGYLAQPQSGGTVRMEVAATNTAVFGNVDLWLASNDNTPRSLRFYEQYQYNSYSPFPNTANYVGFKAPNNIASDVTWTLPDADGSNGQVLFTNGNGVLSWTTPTASGSAGGDLSGSYPNPSIASSAVTSAKIADANVTMAKLAQAGATSGQVIKWNGSAWAPAADDAGSILTNFTESVTTSAPNSTVPAVQLLATNAEANVDVALTPKGTGALGAQVADNTTSGGNKRGENSVDWQMVRSDAAMVASGIKSVVGGGEDNIASADYSATLSGYTNTSNEIGAVVSGGTINTAHGLVSTVGGGTSNSAMSDYSTVSGGMENTAYQGAATVSGGQGNTASGWWSVVGGGYGNYTQGSASVIVGGDHNTIEPTATWTTILGGSQLTMTGSSSIGYLAQPQVGGTVQMEVAATNTAIFGNVDLWLASSDGTAHQLRFYESFAGSGVFPAAGTNYTAFKAGTQSADITYTLPSSAPSVTGQVMSAATDGTLSWTTNTLKVSVANNDPAEVAAGAFANIVVAVTGVLATDAVSMNRAGGFGDLIVGSVFVSAADEITIRVYNPTANPIDLGAADLIFGVVRN